MSGRGDVVPVVAAVIRRGPEYLVGRRPDHKRHGGLWEFPGGKLRDGESDREAATRELGEELGLSVVDVGRTLFAAADPGSPYRIRFVEVRVRGDAVPIEHTALRWATPSELADMPMAPTDGRFVAEFLSLHR